MKAETLTAEKYIRERNIIDNEYSDFYIPIPFGKLSLIDLLQEYAKLKYEEQRKENEILRNLCAKRLNIINDIIKRYNLPIAEACLD